MKYSTMAGKDFGTYLFEDTGCLLWDKCLQCPLPTCKDDLGLKPRGLLALYSRARQFPLVQRTQNVKELVKLTGLTERSVFRLIARYKAADGDYVKFLGVE